MLKINGKVSHKNFLILHNNFFKNFNKNKSRIRFISLNKYNKYNKKIRNRNYTNDFKNYTYNNNNNFNIKNDENFNFEKNIVLNSINNFILNNFI